MVSLERFNTQLTGIMNDFTKAVMMEVKSTRSYEKENLEKLDTRLDDLCLEATEKIVRIVALVITAKHDPPSIEIEVTEEDLHTDSDDPPPYFDVPDPELHTSEPMRQQEADERHRDRSTVLSEEQRHMDQRLLCASMQPVVKLCKIERIEPCASVEEDPGSRDDDMDEGSMSPSPSPPPTPTRQDDHQYARPFSALALSSAPPPEPMTVSCKWPQCRSMFPSAERLDEHYRKVHPECETCGMLFTGAKKLRAHRIKVHGVLPFKCDHCGRGFKQKPHRDGHVKKKHTMEKSYHCDICGKAYASAESVKVHRVVHFDRSFTCDVCGKRFYHSSHLGRHRRTHEDPRPHRCPTCGKGFAEANYLVRHQATVHADIRESHLCSICGKTYASRESLQYHVVAKHPEAADNKESLITCNVCGKKFQFSCLYKLHKASHDRARPFSCHVCGKRYKQKQTLGYHMLTHTGDLPYKCHLCGKSFNLRGNFQRHVSTHSGETPYSCKVCHKRFSLLIYLKAHEKTPGHKRRMPPSDVVSTENTQNYFG